MHPILQSILSKRGITDIENFMNPTLKELFPNAYDIPQMDLAVARFIKAIQTQEKIGIFGDYDVDGATSVSLFIRTFTEIQFEVYIPNRLTEGYGPNQKAMDYFKSKDVTLVIFVDCGTKAETVLAYARTLHMDCIVLDHHLSYDALYPDAIIVNPNAHKDLHPYLQNLCAAGVSFIFLASVIKTAFPQHKEKLLSNLDLVALGTVCDVMPLTGFNRALVKQGLKVMNRFNNAGITALASIASIESKIRAMDLGFAIGPRINAGGRIGQSELGYKILSSRSNDEAILTATVLNKLNLERRDIQQAMLEEAIQEIETHNLNAHKLIILGKTHWHPGVVGIVAGRLKDLYHKPALIIGFHEGQSLGIGSGRAPEGFSVTAFLDDAVQHNVLVAGGGHDAAFGFKVHESQIPDFYAFMIQKTDTMTLPIKEHHIDITLNSFENIDLNFLEALEQLEPYGQKNPEPVFLIENVSVFSYQMLKGKHFKGIFKDQQGRTLSALCFNADPEKYTPEKGPLNIITKIVRNTWNGESSVQLMLI